MDKCVTVLDEIVNGGDSVFGVLFHQKKRTIRINNR